MLSESVKKALTVIGIFALAACGPADGDSLLADASSDPSSHSLNKEPTSSDLYISSSSVNISIPAAQTKVELSGECFPSTYSNHYIIGKLGTNQVGLTDINKASGSTNRATCKNGRFNLAVNVNGWATGNYTLELRMMAYNDPSNVVTNDVKGVFRFNLTRY